MHTAITADVEKDVEEKEEVVTHTGPMQDLLDATPKRPMNDDVVEGPVVAIGRARVFVDLHPFGTGIIYGREYLSARESLKNTNIGDIITAKVVGTEKKEGYIELSLREARKACPSAFIEHEAAVAELRRLEQQR